MNAGPFNHVMREVLQQSRYDVLTGRATDWRALAEDALARLAAFILEHLPDFGLPQGTGINADAVAVFFAVAGGLALLTAAVAFVRRARRGRKTAAEDTLGGVWEEMTRRDMTAAEWRALSERHYARGEYREAVRYRYIAALTALRAGKVIRLHASHTNAQIARELGLAAPALAARFAVVADCFHRVWFGYKPLDEGEYARFAAAAEELAA